MRDIIFIDMIKLIDILNDKTVNFHTKKLHEGLIKTTPTDQAIKIISKEVSYLKNVDIFNEGSYIFLEFEPQYLSDTFDFSNIHKVLILANNLGYFVSMFTYINDKGADTTEKYTSSSFKNIIINKKPKVIILQFESKYDSIVDIPRYVYHITSADNINKIKRIGLTPRTQSKLSNHPERIYVSLDEENSSEMYWEVRGFFRNKTGIELVIDTNQLNQPFYDDPNFQDSGVYTYKNIPPQAIVQYRAIKELPLEGRLIREPL
jgi:hypothetical protein